MNTTTAALAQNQVLPSITPEEAKELDYIICVDQSGSMGDPSDKMEGKTRWEEAAEFTIGLARYAEQHDDDGLTVIKFNSHAKVYDGVKASAVSELFTKNQPMGSTNLAEGLREAFKKKLSSSKRAYVLVLTDGVPDSQSDVIKEIVNMTNKIEADNQIGVQFVQIGSDSSATSFLHKLDDELEGKGAKYDIVNHLSREQAESMNVEQMIWAAFND